MQRWSWVLLLELKLRSVGILKVTGKTPNSDILYVQGMPELCSHSRAVTQKPQTQGFEKSCSTG